MLFLWILGVKKEFPENCFPGVMQRSLIWELCITPLIDNYVLLGAPIRPKWTGPLKRANPELFEAVRPSLALRFTACQNLVSKAMDGSKSTYEKVKRGYAKLSIRLQFLFFITGILSLTLWTGFLVVAGNRYIAFNAILRKKPLLFLDVPIWRDAGNYNVNWRGKTSFK